MKKFVGANPQSFLDWLCLGMMLESILPTELHSRNIFVDFLCKVMLDGKPCLIHIEFQRNIKAGIPMRLLEYNVLASREYKELPVYSFVIYLVDDGTIEESPLIRKLPNGKEVLRFYYESIRLWDMDPNLFWQPGREGILPLVILTTGNSCPEVIEAVIQRLIVAGKEDLLPVTKMLASLVCKNNPEYSEWIDRRFAMLQDILRDTDAYQQILREGEEKGYKEGKEEGKEEGKLLASRQMLINLIQVKFPEAVSLAKRSIDTVDDVEVLQAAAMKMFSMQTIEELFHLLLGMDKA
jgi:predicted transposase YdaD